MISLHVNGKTVVLDEETRLLDYLAGLGVDPRAVAVELNGVILDRSEFGPSVLRNGDRLEIVRMVGGGAAGRRARSNTRFRPGCRRRSPPLF